jgi:hypothetical protein
MWKEESKNTIKIRKIGIRIKLRKKKRRLRDKNEREIGGKVGRLVAKEDYWWPRREMGG